MSTKKLDGGILLPQQGLGEGIQESVHTKKRIAIVSACITIAVAIGCMVLPVLNVVSATLSLLILLSVAVLFSATILILRRSTPAARVQSNEPNIGIGGKLADGAKAAEGKDFIAEMPEENFIAEIDALREKIPSHDEMCRKFEQQCGGYGYGVDDDADQTDHLPENRGYYRHRGYKGSWEVKGPDGKSQIQHFDVQAPADITDKYIHTVQVRNFLRACQKLGNAKMGDYATQNAVRSGNWEDALCPALTEMEKCLRDLIAIFDWDRDCEQFTHNITKSMHWNVNPSRRDEANRRIKALLWGMPELYRAFLNATYEFAMHNPTYLSSFTLEESEQMNQGASKSFVPSEEQRTEMENTYGDYFTPINEKSSLRMGIVKGVEVSALEKKMEEVFGSNVEYICQGANEMAWLDTNMQGKMDFRNILDDLTQGPVSAYINVTGTFIRGILSISGKLPGAASRTDVTYDKKMGMIEGYQYTSYEPISDDEYNKMKTNGCDNQIYVCPNGTKVKLVVDTNKIKGDAEKLKQNRSQVAMLPQVYTQNGKTYLYGLCGAARAWAQLVPYRLTREMYALCEDSLVPQFEALAHIAKRKWQTQTDGKPVVLNLNPVGMASYNNHPYILAVALRSVVNILGDTGVIVALQGYSDWDVKLWNDTITTIRDEDAAFNPSTHEDTQGRCRTFCNCSPVLAP
ncbi:MAG: hypothetical protein LBI69_02065 [Puniceicoccales bacterium]|jgi:hypothetical protein|nr:hypothetical protein [Puniceicoccales bacterium]